MRAIIPELLQWILGAVTSFSSFRSSLYSIPNTSGTIIAVSFFRSRRGWVGKKKKPDPRF
jgi:hypothetical protein